MKNDLNIFNFSLYNYTWILLVFLLCFEFHRLSAQSIAINTDGSSPDTKAVLDLKSTTQGVLFPRMTTAQRTAIASPTAGLMIYDTDLKMLMMQNGTSGSPSWETSATTVTTWNLLGNASTTAGTNFVGTTDAVDLVFKTSNTENMRLTSSGDLGIGGTPSSSKLSITKSYANSTGSPINNYFNQKNSTTLSGTSAFTNSGGSRIDVSSSNTSSSNVLKGQLITMQTTGTAAADSVIGLEINMMNSSSGTIGKEYGIKISDINPQSGTLTNTVGLYIGDMTRGTQTNGAYAMYSTDANARNYYAGKNGFGAINPTANLHVSGTLRFEDGTNDDDGKILQMVGGQVQSAVPAVGVALTVSVKTTTYTLTSADDIVILTGAGSVNFYLPLANNVVGKIFIIQNESGGTLTLNLNGSDTEIIGEYSSGTTISIAAGEQFRVASMGSNKYVILSSNR